MLNVAQGLGEAFGRDGEGGVLDGGAVTSGVDGVHDGESATDAEGEAEEEADHAPPVEGHSRRIAGGLVRARGSWVLTAVGQMLYAPVMHKILHKLQRELADGLSGLTAEQAQMRVGPKKWSIQQIVEHLLLTYESTSNTFEARIKKGTATKASPSLKQRVMQYVVTTVGIFPKGRLAPERVRPPDPTLRGLSGVELNARVAEALFPMDASLDEAERIFGAKKRAVTHAVLGPLTVDQWRWFHFVHGEHHLRQILATRRTFHI